MYYIVYLDSFNLEVEHYNDKNEALERISWLMSKDSYLTKDKIELIYGDRIFLHVEETRTVEVSEDGG